MNVKAGTVPSGYSSDGPEPGRLQIYVRSHGSPLARRRSSLQTFDNCSAITVREHVPEARMSSPRRKYTAEFKARVALEALRGELSLPELARKYAVQPRQIASWKEQAWECLLLSFAARTTKQGHTPTIQGSKASVHLSAQEKNFLQKPFGKP